MLPTYWLRLSVNTLLGTVVVSKLYFLLLLMTWGALPQPLYDALMYITHWPSLLTDTFPWYYDSRGTRGVSFPLGISDLRSVVANFLGYLLVTLAIDYLFRRVNAELES